jgi:hypothetical protein
MAKDGGIFGILAVLVGIAIIGGLLTGKGVTPPPPTPSGEFISGHPLYWNTRLTGFA